MTESVTADLARIVRAVEAQYTHPDWGVDAKKHSWLAAIAILDAVEAIRRAELGIPCQEVPTR